MGASPVTAPALALTRSVTGSAKVTVQRPTKNEHVTSVTTSAAVEQATQAGHAIVFTVNWAGAEKAAILRNKKEQKI